MVGRSKRRVRTGLGGENCAPAEQRRGRSIHSLQPAEWETTKMAASLKASFGLGYADSFAAALAQSSAATLVAADHDFDKVEKVVQVVQLL
jgi:predicted nucleic acid-binding protein